MINVWYMMSGALIFLSIIHLLMMPLQTPIPTTKV